MTISITADGWIECTHCERRFQRPTPRRRAAFIRTHARGCSAPDIEPRRHSAAKRASDIDIITRVEAALLDVPDAGLTEVAGLAGTSLGKLVGALERQNRGDLHARLARQGKRRSHLPHTGRTATRVPDITAALAAGLPVDEIAAQHGISPKELRKWCRRRGHMDLVVQLGGRVS